MRQQGLKRRRGLHGIQSSLTARPRQVHGRAIGRVRGTGDGGKPTMRIFAITERDIVLSLRVCPLDTDDGPRRSSASNPKVDAK